MPKLYAFVACEKVVIDETGIASLISLFTTLTGTIPPEEGEIPSNAVVPKEWAIFTAWDWDPSDEGKEYSQSLEILYPDGTVFVKRQEARFAMQPGKRHQIRANLVGFPVGQQGKYAIRMWLEHEGSVILEPQSIHLMVQHQREAKPS